MNAPALIPARCAIERLRAATRVAHRRLEDRLGAVERFADPARRPGLVARFMDFHLPAAAALAPFLCGLPDLAFEPHRASAAHVPGAEPPPPFPQPTTRAEALGLFYVVEGSTLGGHVILRELARRGVADPALAFLAPYGPETGARWRRFMAVLEREAPDERRLSEAEDGAVRGFAHAEHVLCGSGD